MSRSSIVFSSLWLVSAVPALAGCSWSSWDEVEDNTPAVLLEAPEDLAGFGTTFATSRVGDTTRLMLGGAAGPNRAVVYSMGSGDQPGLSANNIGYCDTRSECSLANQVAGRGVWLVPMMDAGTAQASMVEKTHCFVLGYGFIPYEKPASVEPAAWLYRQQGLAARCEDKTEFILEIPHDEGPRSVMNLVSDVFGPAAIGHQLTLASTREEHAALAAAAPESNLLWYYAPDGTKPSALFPKAGELTGVSGLGTHLAVARVESAGARLVLAADAAGGVHVFSIADGDGAIPGTPKAAEYRGCVGGKPGFGRALAVGSVQGGADEDVAIADDTHVTVFSGAALAALTGGGQAGACTLSGLPTGSVLASFGCGTDGLVGSCDGANFGASLAIGDFDGDGDGEVVVGAPRMTVRDNSAAGAVLVYDVEGSERAALAGSLFLSSGEADDELGTGVTAARLTTGRDVIVATAPGPRKAALFYCPPLAGFGGTERCP